MKIMNCIDLNTEPCSDATTVKQRDLCQSRVRLAVIVIISVLGGSVHGANVWGLKSAGSEGTSPNEPASMTPAHLFRFDDAVSNFLDLGKVTRGGDDIDVDALAVSSTEQLFAYELIHAPATGLPVTASYLVKLDPADGSAERVGTQLDREMRGAAFDMSGGLWGLDSLNNNLLGIDQLTGNVLDIRNLNLAGAGYDLSDRCDIAFDISGTAWVVDRVQIVLGGTPYVVPGFYTLDISTGELTLQGNDDPSLPEPPDGNPLLQLVGNAFSPDAGFDSTLMFTLDIASDEDIWTHDVDSAFLRSPKHISIIPSFDAGRGDLGAAPVPEPATLALLLAGGLALLRRKRST